MEREGAMDGEIGNDDIRDYGESGSDVARGMTPEGVIR